jgi:hypothetical protein
MAAIPVLLTIGEFARRLGVTGRRSRALAASGRIEGAVKIGRDWLIPVGARISPGTRGPRPRAAAGTSRLVLASAGQPLALKQKRQKRFRARAARSSRLARDAVVFRLPRETLRFKEPDLDFEDLR